MRRHCYLSIGSLVGLLLLSPMQAMAQSVSAGNVKMIVPGETEIGCGNGLPRAVEAAGEEVHAYPDESRPAVLIKRSNFAIYFGCYYYKPGDIVIVNASVAGETRDDMIKGIDVAEKLMAALDSQRPW